MVIVTLTNQKGGVAKTTTALALANGLHKKKKRVLMVDMDAQSNLSFATGVDLLNLEASMYDVFKEAADVREAVQTVKDGLDIVTGGLQMAAADMEFTSIGREYLLKKNLDKLSADYDFCIIDTPPTLGVLTMNALTASHKVIIPLFSDIFSLQGISQLQGFIQNVREYCNPDLEIAGLLLTKYTSRTNIAQALDEQIQNAATTLGTKVFNTRIRQAVAVQESQLLKGDIYTKAPRATATHDYMAFVDEFLRNR